MIRILLVRMRTSDFAVRLTANRIFVQMDGIHKTNDYAGYKQDMVYTNHIGCSIDEVRGLLMAPGLEKKDFMQNFKVL